MKKRQRSSSDSTGTLQIMDKSRDMVKIVEKYADKGNKSETINNFNKALNYLESHKEEISDDKPLLSEMYNTLAIALVKVERQSDAIKIFDKAIFWNPNNTEALVNKGETLSSLVRKMYDDVMSSFDTALKIDPNNKRALSYKAEAHEIMNQMGDARECYQQIIQNYPEDIEYYDRLLRITPDDKGVWQARGEALASEGRNDEALESYEKALKLDPEDGKLLTGKAWILEDLGRYDEAISLLNDGIKKDPQNKDILTGLGQIYHKKGEHAEALASYENALKIDSKDHDIWNHKGALLLEMERTDESLSAYRTAHDLAPEDMHTLNNLRDILKTLHLNHDLLEICNKILDLDPSNLEVMTEKAYILLSEGQVKQGLGFFENVLEIDPNNLDALHGRKDAMKVLEDFEEVNITCERILAIDKENPRVWEDKALALEKLIDLEGANSAYESAIVLEPENIGYWIKKKDVLKNLKKHEDVILACQVILEKVPDNVEVLSDCGESYEIMEHYDEALSAYSSILKSDPQNVDVMKRKGRVLCKMGSSEESLKFFDMALETEKEDKTLWNYRGQALFKMGDYEEAKHSYESALILDPNDGQIWINKTLTLFNMNNFDEAMEAMNTAMDHSDTIDSSKGGLQKGIDTEINVFIQITKSITSEDERNGCQQHLSKAKAALGKENYEKAHRFCMECKNIIEGYTKTILEGTDQLMEDLAEMDTDTSEYGTLIQEMKVLIEKRNYPEAYPLSEKIRNGILKQQYNIVSDIFNTVKGDLKSAESSQLDVKKQKKKMAEAKDAAQDKLYKKAYDLILESRREIQNITEKHGELSEALDVVIEKVRDAQEKGVDIEAIKKKLTSVKAAISINEFKEAADLITECENDVKNLLIKQTISEKMSRCMELIDLIKELELTPTEVEGHLKKTNDLISENRFEDALASLNQTQEMAETLCNLKILEMLTQIKSRINEEKKFGIEVMSAEVIYKKTEDYLLQRRFKMAALYARKSLDEVEEIRDESLRAAYIIRLGKSYISEADIISADTQTAREVYKKAISGLEHYQYFSAIEMGNKCIKEANRSKEQKVGSLISTAKTHIEKSRSEGKSTENAEKMISESESVLRDRNYFKAMKLAIMSLEEFGPKDIQKNMVRTIIDEFKDRFRETIQQGMNSDIVRTHIKNAEKSQNNGDYVMASDCAIMGIKELSVLREEYDRASISLIAAKARLHEVENTGFDVKDIKLIFDQAKKEFTAGNFNESLKLVKKTIKDSKQFYKEHLKKPIAHCEQLVKTAEDIGANVIRANNILLEAKAALDEELFSQVPLFVENCEKIAEREIKKKLYDKLSETREQLKQEESNGKNINEAIEILERGETSLENKRYADCADFIKKALSVVQ